MLEPKRIGKYEIIEEIGRGGFAAVYKARDTELDRIVALKVLHPYWSEDPGFSARFRREARAAANLRHSNIVTVYEAGEATGQLYIAMEYLPGRTLRALLEAEGALPLERALLPTCDIPASSPFTTRARPAVNSTSRWNTCRAARCASCWKPKR
jgi:serine/threonine protein kinase